MRSTYNPVTFNLNKCNQVVIPGVNEIIHGIAVCIRIAGGKSFVMICGESLF